MKNSRGEDVFIPGEKGIQGWWIAVIAFIGFMLFLIIYYCVYESPMHQAYDLRVEAKEILNASSQALNEADCLNNGPFRREYLNLVSTPYVKRMIEKAQEVYSIAYDSRKPSDAEQAKAVAREAKRRADSFALGVEEEIGNCAGNYFEAMGWYRQAQEAAARGNIKLNELGVRYSALVERCPGQSFPRIRELIDDSRAAMDSGLVFLETVEEYQNHLSPAIIVDKIWSFQSYWRTASIKYNDALGLIDELESCFDICCCCCGKEKDSGGE